PRIILFYSLLCHCSHCLSVRHSFPTRRSSDLWRSEMRLPIKGKKVSKFKFARHLVILAGQGRGRRALARLATSAAESLRLLSSRDRKSTRLNSSHVSISYAVFCLKKKNKVWHN